MAERTLLAILCMVGAVTLLDRLHRAIRDYFQPAKHPHHRIPQADPCRSGCGCKGAVAGLAPSSLTRGDGRGFDHGERR